MNTTEDHDPTAAEPNSDGVGTVMTPDQEHAFYADPDHQDPQGPPVRRRKRSSPLSAPVPVRLPEEVLAQVRERAAADDRSLSQWIRRAVEQELTRTA